ncbi:hypothetical protein BST83_13330 [Polaribacter filamentus]|uniref:Peptidase S74 domain-containing protein n=1 Tax=Polaribacter filamentus TaxID=53483 RepID=A0A2S7KZC5_9FLAO|nr:tail fiber domain-containing protein [Polaribacter filamentus]PQB08024.1 hypothetical protein BST83_13330 [Polaribacter filamentus]
MPRSNYFSDYATLLWATALDAQNVKLTGNQSIAGEKTFTDVVVMTNRLDLNDSLDNTFIGEDSGIDNTTGARNTSLGYQSLTNNTTGVNNVSLGHTSMFSNTTGFTNISIGYASLRSNIGGDENLSIGSSALFSNTEGNENTALGVQSLSKITTGSSNIGVGNRSGRNIADGTTANETGSNSIFIGQDTRANADGESNQIVIGYSAKGNGSNTVTIGNDIITDTYLKGDVQGSGAATFASSVSATNFIGNLNGLNSDHFVQGSNSSRWLSPGGTAIDVNTIYKAGFYALSGLNSNVPSTGDAALLNMPSWQGNLSSSQRYNFQLFSKLNSSDVYNRGTDINGAGTWYKMLNTANFIAGTNYQAPLSNVAFTNVNNNFSVAQTFASSVSATDGLFSGANAKISVNNTTSTLSDITLLDLTSVVIGSGVGNERAILLGQNDTPSRQAKIYYKQNAPNGQLPSLHFSTGDVEALRLNSDQSATFASSVSATKATINGGATITEVSNFGSNANTVFSLANPSVKLGIGYNSADIPLIQGYSSTNAVKNVSLNPYGGNIMIGSSTNNGSKLQVNGAATFASSVSAGGTIESTGNIFRTRFNSTYFTDLTTSSISFNGASQTFSLIQNGVNRFKIESNGSATFASSVSATDFTGNWNGGDINNDATFQNGKVLRFERDTYNTRQVGINSQGFYLYDVDRAQVVFSSSDATGAATFASSVSATGGIFSGDVLIGKTVTDDNVNGATVKEIGLISASRSGNVSGIFNRNSSTGSLVLFRQAGTQVGSISVTGSATSYNTSSDYRLKEDLKDFNGLEMISNIPVYDYKWKVDESRSYGVMAHELQEVLPQAVSGEKDAEEMQGVDYSKIVPLLIKAIQELKAEIELLKNKN